MISSLRMANFKNFKDETLYVGPFTVIAGANASGKSNIRDAFRLLHGIGCRYSLADVLGGRYGPDGQIDWLPIRGALNEIVRFGEEDLSLDVSFGELLTHEAEGVRLDISTRSYSLTVGPDTVATPTFRVKRESLDDLSA